MTIRDFRMVYASGGLVTLCDSRDGSGKCVFENTPLIHADETLARYDGCRLVGMYATTVRPEGRVFDDAVVVLHI